MIDWFMIPELIASVFHHNALQIRGITFIATQ